MSNFNARGQETQIRLTQGGILVRTIDVRSSSFSFDVTILNENYLGKTTPSKDEIFNGLSGNLSVHFSGQEIFELIQKVVDRATRRAAVDSFVAVISAFILLPNGDRPRITALDAKFGAIPVNIGGRDQYNDITLNFESETFRLGLT